jgi:3-phenylpropionate/cinnamic acid dioxygenase small subunit
VSDVLTEPAMSRAEAEDFLLHEVRMLDERRLEEWLELFTEDGVYWLPIQEDKGPNESTSIIYDTSVRREERVYRLLHTIAPVEDPPHRTLHTVNNVEVEERTAGDLVVLSTQVIYAARTGVGVNEVLMFPARCEHTLRHDGVGWRIAAKRVLLINRDHALPSLPFIL